MIFVGAKYLPDFLCANKPLFANCNPSMLSICTTISASSSYAAAHLNGCRGFRGRSFSQLRSSDLVDLEYAQLGLKEKLDDVGHVRIRQHVNPLSSSFLIPAQVPDWQHVFKDPTLPLMVDVGSGSGRFLIWLAKEFTESKNYLGLEIRHKLVKRAQSWVDDLQLKNIHFIFANATVSFEQLVSEYPGPLMLVSILPDLHHRVVGCEQELRTRGNCKGYSDFNNTAIRRDWIPM